MGLTHKACWECVEKMDIIHKVRLTLALLSETRIMEEVTTNCLGSGITYVYLCHCFCSCCYGWLYVL